MLPLRDINPTRTTPYATYALIALNVAVFVYQYLLVPSTDAALLVERHGVIPFYLFSGYGPSLSTPFTSMFIHGGLGHLASNMWFLHVFGDNVEDQLGAPRFLLFYFATGLCAVLVHALMDTSSMIPMVGASGAISGVLAGYILMFPRARIVTFLIIFLMEVPAGFFILVWFAMQVFSGLGQLGMPTSPGVAFLAHIGGFVSGVALLLLFGIPERRPVARLGPRVSRSHPPQSRPR